MIGGDGEELAAAAGNTKTKTKIPPILPDDPLDLPPLFQDVSYRLLYTYLCAKCCTIITTALYKTFALEKIMNQILNERYLSTTMYIIFPPS